MTEFGTEEGDLCKRDGCCGRIIILPRGECSCHISPPCWACENSFYCCSDCGWKEDELPPLPHLSSSP